MPNWHCVPPEKSGFYWVKRSLAYKPTEEDEDAGILLFEPTICWFDSIRSFQGIGKISFPTKDYDCYSENIGAINLDWSNPLRFDWHGPIELPK